MAITGDASGLDHLKYDDKYILPQRDSYRVTSQEFQTVSMNGGMSRQFVQFQNRPFKVQLNYKAMDANEAFFLSGFFNRNAGRAFVARLIIDGKTLEEFVVKRLDNQPFTITGVNGNFSVKLEVEPSVDQCFIDWAIENYQCQSARKWGQVFCNLAELNEAAISPSIWQSTGKISLPFNNSLAIYDHQIDQYGSERIYQSGTATFNRSTTSTNASGGQLISLAADQPAFAAGGVRVFGEVTNLNVNNDNSQLWSTIRSTMTDTSTDLISGYASRIMLFESTEDTTSAYVNTGNTITFQPSTEYTFQLVVKPLLVQDANNKARLRLHSDQFGTGNSAIEFDHRNDTYLIDGNATDGGFKKLNDGRYLIYVTATTTSSFSSLRSPYFWPTDSTTGDQWELCCWQVNEGGLKPYVPTGAAAVTQSAETCKIPTPSALQGSEWAIVVSYDDLKHDKSYISMGSGSVTDGFFINRGSEVRLGTAYIFQTITYEKSTIVVMLSGGNLSLHTNDGTTTGVYGGDAVLGSELFIGSDGDGNNQSDSYTGKVKFIDRALTDAEIQAELNK